MIKITIISEKINVVSDVSKTVTENDRSQINFFAYIRSFDSKKTEASYVCSLITPSQIFRFRQFKWGLNNKKF